MNKKIISYLKAHPYKAVLIVLVLVVLVYVFYIGYLVVWGDFRNLEPLPFGVDIFDYRPADCSLVGFVTPIRERFMFGEHLAIFIRHCWLP